MGIYVQGKPTYIAFSASFDSSDFSKIILHDKCVISGDVRLLTHDYAVSRIAIANGVQLKKEFRIIKPIEIGENSFIGLRSIIMPGVKIGKNVVVGAGSIVTKNFEDNLIIAGNPAKIITTIEDYWEKIKYSDDIYYE
jgi:acetyltransferase-like isoleucine patch superfamily enzyme